MCLTLYNDNLWCARKQILTSSTIKHLGGMLGADVPLPVEFGNADPKCYKGGAATRDSYEIEWHAKPYEPISVPVGKRLHFRFSSAHDLWRFHTEDAFLNCDFTNAVELAGTDSGGYSIHIDASNFREGSSLLWLLTGEALRRLEAADSGRSGHGACRCRAAGWGNARVVVRADNDDHGWIGGGRGRLLWCRPG